MLILTNYPLLAQECAAAWLHQRDRDLTDCDGVYYNRAGDTVLTIAGLDTELPDDPQALVLALGEVSRGQFPGTMVTAAPAPPKTLSWHSSAADAICKHRLTASNGGSAMSVIIKSSPTGPLDGAGTPYAPYAVRAPGDTDKLQPRDFYGVGAGAAAGEPRDRVWPHDQG